MANNLTIQNARILFRNFQGAETKFNPAGKRNFCVLIDNPTANALLADGWNVKYLKPLEDDLDPQPYLQVSVSFGNIPPKIVMISSKGKTVLDEENVKQLDVAEISNVDMIIRPYNWEVNGKSGIKAYVKSLWVTIAEDELEKKYRDVPEANVPLDANAYMEDDED